MDDNHLKEPLIKRDLLSIADLSSQEIWHLIERATELKRGIQGANLKRKSLALLFEKPSLRTRVSFEVAMREMGGYALYLSPAEVGLGKREEIADVARTLSRYVQGIAARTFSHHTMEELSHYAIVPVINALSDKEHPCQVLGDLLTIYERKGGLEGLTLAFVGDGNNVARSLMLAAATVGMNFRIAAPEGYWLDEGSLSSARELASQSGSQVLCTTDPCEVAKDADVVYTDVWVSMGQGSEAESRRRAFQEGYQVTPELLSLAQAGALFMHPLPAHHGEEIAAGMLEHPQSVVFDQAENRLHIQKAILLKMMG